MGTPLKRSWFGTNQLIYASTVVLAYAPTLWTHGIELGSGRGLACIALGIGYLGLGYFAECDSAAAPELGPFGSALLASVMLAVLAGILFTSELHRVIWLCAYPAAAVMLKLLPAWGTVVAELAIAGLLYAAIFAFVAPPYRFEYSLPLILAQVFVVIFTRTTIRAGRAMDEAIRLSSQLESANRQLRSQANQIAELAMIQERNRLARDIHDGLGHYLTTIHVQLAAARALAPVYPERAAVAVQKAHRLAEDALLEVRRSVGALKAEGPGAPLPERLRDLVASVDATPDALSVRMEVLGKAPKLTNDSDVALYRAAQEGLTNVRKHAAARHAIITLDGTRPGRVILSVVDDGCGAPKDRQGHGLAGLRERLSAVGGEVRAENEPGGGFRLEVQVPVQVA